MIIEEYNKNVARIQPHYVDISGSTSIVLGIDSFIAFDALISILYGYTFVDLAMGLDGVSNPSSTSRSPIFSS
jgi:hypothetical protein